MAKKMALVPADMLGQIKEAPLLTQISNLDRGMGSILQNKQLSTDAKFHQYQDALQRFQMLQHERDRPASVPKETKLPKELLLDVPAQKKKKARILFDFIENIPELDVNRRNEVIISGETIENSNIVDLFAALTLDRQEQPRGFQEFSALLRRNNVPMEAIGNRQRLNILTPARVVTPVVGSAASTPSTAGRRRRPGTPASAAASTPSTAGRRRVEYVDRSPSPQPQPQPHRRSNRLHARIGPQRNYAAMNRGSPIPWQGRRIPWQGI